MHSPRVTDSRLTPCFFSTQWNKKMFQILFALHFNILDFFFLLLHYDYYHCRPRVSIINTPNDFHVNIQYSLFKFQ